MMDVHIVGVGIHAFGRHPGKSGIDLGVHAAREALADAGLAWTDMQFAFGGSEDAGDVDAIATPLGLTGIPVINVANGCATGGSSLLSACWAIRSGEFELGMAVGFDSHARGAFNFDPSRFGLPAWYGETGLMVTAQFMGMKIQRYMSRFGITQKTLGLVAEKAFVNGARAPHAWRRQPVALEVILESALIVDPLTKYMFCSPSEGGAALVLASARKMRELGLSGPRIRGAALQSRADVSFEVFAPFGNANAGPTHTQRAAQKVFEMAAIGPEDVQVAQLQDTESGAEVMNMAENGFCRDGEQEALVQSGATRLGGRLPVNTDGGCIACGEPIGASGLRQIYENILQLRGRAEGRQVENCRIAYSQVAGMPGVSAAVVLESA